MTECSQEFKDMLSKYKSDVHHECLLIDDFLADTGPILQYVAKLEAAYTAPAPAHAVPDADGARFRWLCEDHSARVARERCRGLIDRLPVMSYSDAVMSIDAAMVGGMPEWPST